MCKACLTIHTEPFLKILFASVFQLGDGDASDVTVLEYKPAQQIAVKFTEDLKAGQHCVLTLEYSAKLSHTYDGFYNSSYTDKDGNKRYAWLIGYGLIISRQLKGLLQSRDFIKCMWSSDFTANELSLHVMTRH